jgi:hypothetical protein
MWEILRGIPNQFFVPLPDNYALVQSQSRVHPGGANDFERARSFVTSVLTAPESTFRVQYLAGIDPPLHHVSKDFYGERVPTFPSLQGYEAAGTRDRRRYIACHIGEEEELVLDREDQVLADRRERPPFEFRQSTVLEAQPDAQDFGLGWRSQQGSSSSSRALRISSSDKAVISGSPGVRGPGCPFGSDDIVGM